MSRQRVQVAIIGGGPAGLLLGRLLDLSGIDNLVIERRSQEYVLGRIRAGILEQTTVDLMRRANASDRLDREGIVHEGLKIANDGVLHDIPLTKFADGKSVIAYGQAELTADLNRVRDRSGAKSIYEATEVCPHDFDSETPYVTFKKDGESYRIDCDIITGCDGFYGPCRKAVPTSAIKTYQREYPFAWLGLLADVPPVSHEVVYANSQRGFALCSMRSYERSRYYIQCRRDDRVDQFPDHVFWDEFRYRLPEQLAQAVKTGPSIEKSITPLRSFVAEPIRFGRLLLAGDAAHIVPPTGAKGLNLAASDVHYLHAALEEYFSSEAQRSERVLDDYSSKALRRIWKTQRFSWWLTNVSHRIGNDPFDDRIRSAELDYITTVAAGKRMIAENYVGLPL